MSLFNRLRGRIAAAPNDDAGNHAVRRAVVETLETRRLLATTVQILHASDFEAGVPAIEDAPRFSSVLNALRDDFDATLTLSSGDNWIPSPFYAAAADPALEPVLGAAGKGRADVAILNALGVQATVFGNHEFDEGPAQVASIIGPSDAYPGTEFPYLSANLDFAGTPLESFVVPDGQDADAIPNGGIARTTTITVDGETFGLVGITTPLLPDISSPGGVAVLPEDADDLAALAAVVQPSIDALAAAGVDKVIALSHLQDVNNEIALAPLLSGVDVLIAGGGNQILADDTDRLRANDEAFDTYPILSAGADGDPIAIVNVDRTYTYVGRLVVDFNDDGTIDPASIDPDVSGAYATDAQGVIDTGNVAPDPRVVEIAQAVGAVVEVKDGNTFGRTDVYLNGNRADVRTQETNFGDLSADANLFAARQADPTTVVSLKNGGGIRDSIGEVVPATGELIPPQANAFKGAGEVSQLDIENSLRFNNGLSLLTLTAEQLVEVVEHGVADSGGGSQPGRFPQIGGFAFSFDVDRPAGDRVVSLAVTRADGTTDVVVQDGAIVGDPARTFRTVTLGFLADGGDGYPFPTDAAVDRVDLEGADAGFDTPGGEQLALADYLAANFADAPFAIADVPAALDERIQDLAERDDTVIPDDGTDPEPAGDRLELIDADTDEVIRVLSDGDAIDLADVAARNFSVRAVFDDGTVGSVVFGLNGQAVNTENVAPYALFRNVGDDFFAGAFAPGGQTVTATAFAGPNGTGGQVGQLDVSFAFAYGATVESATLFDAAADAEVADVTGGGTVALADVLQPTVVVETGPAAVGSVRFAVDGVAVNVEDNGPYALFRNVGSDLFAGNALQPGGRTLSVTPFSGAGATGVAGATLDILLDVVPLPGVFA